MSEHTPGPWTIRNDPVQAEWVVIDMGEDGIIPVHPFKDWKSNADLARKLAAAPDLLAALEELVEHHDDEFGHTAWFEQARAAIARAKGEQDG